MRESGSGNSLFRSLCAACPSRALLLLLLCGFPFGRALSAEPVPALRAWVFMGHPGDDERRETYRWTVRMLRDGLAGPLRAREVTVLFGDGGTDGLPACTREKLLAECERICAAVAAGDFVWVFFLGHSDSAGSGANYNLHGADVSAAELGLALRHAPKTVPHVFFLTTAASGRWLPSLGHRGRILVAAAGPEAEDNETEFPHALAALLSSPASGDANGDGVLSVDEIVRSVRASVAETYRADELVLTEGAEIDGDGDGKASGMPSSADERAASRVGLTIR